MFLKLFFSYNFISLSIFSLTVFFMEYGLNIYFGNSKVKYSIKSPTCWQTHPFRTKMHQVVIFKGYTLSALAELKQPRGVHHHYSQPKQNQFKCSAWTENITSKWIT